MADELQIQTDNDFSHISLLKNAYQKDFSQTNIIPVTEGEMQSILCSPKQKIQVGMMDFQRKNKKCVIHYLVSLFHTAVINLYQLVFFLTVLNMQL